MSNLFRRCRASGLLAGLLLFTAGSGIAADGTLADIQRLNSNIAAVIGGGAGPDAAAVDLLVSQRQALVSQLIKESPGAVRDAALDSTAAAWVRANVAGAEDLVERAGEWSGTLEIVAEMDYANHKAWTHRYLRTASGRMELFGQARIFKGIDSRGGATVSVRGIGVTGRIAADTIRATTTAAASLTLSPLGVENFAVLIVTDTANPALPASWTSAAIQNLFFGASGLTLNTFWQEASYGLTSATGTVFGPFRLAQNYTCDAADASDSEALVQSAITAAAGTVNFSQYNRIALVFPSNKCSYGGLATIGGASYTGLANLTSVSWFPVETSQTPASYIGVVAHEGGHNLGLNHANSEDYGSVPLGAPGNDGIDTEYGDPFSAMDAGDQVSNDSSPAQYSAQHKVQILNWLDPTGYQQIAAAGNYSVLPLEGTSGTRGLRVLRDPVTQSWLWLESRQAIGLADGSLGTARGSNIVSGLLVHYENPDLDSLHTYLLDFHPTATPNNFDTAALLPGQTWADPYSLLTLTVNTVSLNGSTVTVNYDTPCATLSSAGTVIPLAGGTGKITVTAPASCAWTASTASSWLTLGTVSGQGNGTVTFTASNNSTAGQLDGVIVVGRQSIAVVQEATGISGVTTPLISGGGVTGTFALEFADSYGTQDIQFIDGIIGGSAYDWTIGNCYFQVDTAGYIWLENDAATDFLGPLYFNGGQMLSNSTCTIYAVGSSLVMSGNTIKASLSIRFASSIDAQLGVYGFAYSNAAGNWSDPFTFGSWFASSLASDRTTIRSTPNPAQAGQTVTFTGTVSSSAATGSVTFRDGTTVLGTSPIGGGMAALSTGALGSGLHSITASYSGDSANVPSTSMTLTQSVTGASAAVTLTSSPNPSTAGAAVALTASVSPVSATGTVTFTDSGTNLGTASLAGGSATLTTSTLKVGTHSIAAVYSGDAADSGSTSAVLTQTVSAAAILPVITGVANNPSPSGAIASGTWLTIYGNNLCSASGLVNLTGTALVTSEAGTSATINGKLVYLDYVSNTQLNVLTPVDAATGPVTVQVTTPMGQSNTVTVTKTTVAPALFPFSVQNGKYAAAEDAVTYGLIGSVGLLDAGYPTQPAVPGEILTVFATGLGETTPAYPDGQIITVPLPLTQLLTITIGTMPAVVQAAALISPGFYQINFVVPQLPAGDAAIVLGIDGVQSPAGLFLTIR